METQNVTLALPKDILRKAKLTAGKQLLIEEVAQEDRYAKARSRHLEVLRRGADLGTRGTVGWTREDLHAR